MKQPTKPMMIKKALLYCLLFTSVFCFSQETKFKEYSYTEVFDMIAAEKDTLFKLSNAFVRYNTKTDSLFTAEVNDNDDILTGGRKKQLVIEKELAFNNVHFFSKSNFELPTRGGVMNNILFKKKVSFTTVLSATFLNCVFEEELRNNTQEEIEDALKEAVYRFKRF
ncbi:MAG: hypothetical protein P8I51_10915 [Polaribacter sp.]|nr:hypothetical protein [Polaribacter sp.]MDG1955388.1 hypothetical protein [Polaribacter sp.]MDG2074001.1 hypothetical protein [Polaribacter sp.]